MSVSPTEDALIVALDFEGELAYPIPYIFDTVIILKFYTQQVSTISSILLRKKRFSHCSIPLFLIS